MTFDQVMERVMKRQEIILRAISGEINWVQAADICGITARQMRRLKWKYQNHGFSMLMDGRHGKRAWNRAPVDETKKILDLYRETYFDFNVQHFREKLRAEHHVNRSYSWVKKILQCEVPRYFG